MVLKYKKHRKDSRRRFYAFLAFLLIIAAATGASMYISYLLKSSRYDVLIKDAADKYCLDPRLLKAVVWKESNFVSQARGNDDEVGLMQVIPSNKGAAQDWANYHKVDLPCPGILFNPRLNIEIGAWYLARAMKKHKNAEWALCEYNAGPRIKSWKPEIPDGEVIKKIKFRSTKAYVTAIMKKYREYCNANELDLKGPKN